VGDARALGGSGIGLDYSRRIGRWTGIDLTLSNADLGHGHSGFGMGAMGQILVSDDFGDSLVLAAGPSFVDAPEFGGVAFLTTEIGYDLRRRGLPSFLLAVGPEWALNDSGFSFGGRGPYAAGPRATPERASGLRVLARKQPDQPAARGPLGFGLASRPADGPGAPSNAAEREAPAPRAGSNSSL
jgi:hypothetical protein